MAALLAPTFSWSFERSCTVTDEGYRAVLDVQRQTETDRQVEGETDKNSYQDKSGPFDWNGNLCGSTELAQAPKQKHGHNFSRLNLLN